MTKNRRLKTRTLTWTPEHNSVASTFSDDHDRAVLVTLDSNDDPDRQHFLHLAADDALYLAHRLLHCVEVIQERTG